MSLNHDTVKEELTDILEGLQSAYRKSHPNDLILFTAHQVAYTLHDVSGLIAEQPSEPDPLSTYMAYRHRYLEMNGEGFGMLKSEIGEGTIDINFSDFVEDNSFKFRMLVADKRVTGYSIPTAAGDYLTGLTREHIKESLQRALS